MNKLILNSVDQMCVDQIFVGRMTRIPAELRLLKWVLVEGAKKGNLIMHNVIIIKNVAKK